MERKFEAQYSLSIPSKIDVTRSVTIGVTKESISISCLTAHFTREDIQTIIETLQHALYLQLNSFKD